MSHLRASVTGSSSGFDSSRNLLVLPINGTIDLYLVAGADLEPVLEGEAVAVAERKTSKGEQSSRELDAWERANGIRAFTFRGKTLGNGTFRARTRGTTIDQIAPLTVRVTANKDNRQAGDGPKGQPVISPELRLELAALPFRDALVRLAEDQMNSAIGHEPKGGFGCYGLAAKNSLGQPNNWCGAFVHWLYKRVAEIKGVRNPFGDDVNTLASPQKAIGYALHRPDDLTLVQFAGTDPYGWSWPPNKDKHGKAVGDHPALKAEMVPVTPVSGPPMTGDVCLVRASADPAKGWKHVCMVLTTPNASGQFYTFDGNQGGDYDPRTNAIKGCIGINSHNVADMAKSGGVTKFSFVAVKLPGDDEYRARPRPAQMPTN